jgi:hypothetical protein
MLVVRTDDLLPNQGVGYERRERTMLTTAYAAILRRPAMHR